MNKSPEAVAEANAKGDEAAKQLGDPRVKKRKWKKRHRRYHHAIS
ncbi:Uncharacterised protein [Actinobacillus equuli]|nr:Uncharacterised protein [Actinobacillus equuli]